jgi:phosphoesterase RecJ-like protein
MKLFTESMIKIKGQKNLILCHDQADSDAIGAAYALSRFIGAEVGVPQQLAAHTLHLIEQLEMAVLHTPQICDYENVIIVDTAHSSQLGECVPKRFFVIDHHANNQLVENAEAVLHDEVSSTSQLIYRVLRQAHIPIDKKMAIARCAGILTDTIHFHKGDAEAFQVFGELLDTGGLQYEDIQQIYVVEERKDRGAIIDAALSATKASFAGYHILLAKIDTNIPTYAARAFIDLGADASVVSYQQGQDIELRVYIRNDLVTEFGVQAIDVIRQSPSMKKGKTWGSALFAGFRSNNANLDLVFEDILRYFHSALATEAE